MAGKKRRREHPEKHRAKNKKWRDENPEKHKAYNKKWAKENPEKRGASNKKWREENPEEYKEVHQRYRDENPEKIKAATEKWRRENPEKVKVQKEDWERRHPGYHPSQHLKQKYGITLDDYNEMVMAQEGKCALCGKMLERVKRRHPVDHDHSKEGRASVRGILHLQCNLLIGIAERHPGILDMAKTYIEFHARNVRPLPVGFSS